MKETRQTLSPNGLVAIRQALIVLATNGGNAEGAKKIQEMSDEEFRPGAERLVCDLLADLIGEEEDVKDG